MRACGVADLVFFSVEDPALYRVHASRLFADGLYFARIRFVTHMLINKCLDANETRSHRASSSVSLTESLLKKIQEPRLVTYAALNHFGPNLHDVKIIFSCLGGIMHPRVTQTRPMNVSMGSIATENSLKTIVYLRCKYFELFRCVRTSCVHVRSPQIVTVRDKDHFLLRTMC